MRTRKEIEEEFSGKEMRASDHNTHVDYEPITLEVLLDIRELLSSNIKEKE